MPGLGAAVDMVKSGVDKLLHNSFDASPDALLSRFPAGKAFMEHYKNFYKPELLQETQQWTETYLKDPNTIKRLGGVEQTIRKAHGTASSMVRDYHYGKDRHTWVDLVEQAHRHGGSAYARQVSDNLSLMFQEEGDRQWRQVVESGGGSHAGLGIGIKPSGPYRAPSALESKFRKGFNYIALNFVAIPHTFQATLNQSLNNSFSSMLKGWSEMLKDPAAAVKFATRSGTLTRETEDAFRDATHNKFQRTLDKVLYMPGMPWLRKWQVVSGGLVGKHQVIEYATEFVKNGSKDAEAGLKQFGFKPADILANAQAGRPLIEEEELQRAAFINADRTMFVGANQRIPVGWGSNATTRLAFMYKGYAFSEMSTIKDAVRRSFDRSPAEGIKSLLVLGAMFPLAGESIKAASFFVRGRPMDQYSYQKNNIVNPEKLGRLYNQLGLDHPDSYASITSEGVDAFAEASGLGLYMSMYRQARRSSLSSWAMGPIFSTAADVAQDIASFHGEHLSKLVAGRLGIAGPYIANKVIGTKTQTERRLATRENSVQAKRNKIYKRNASQQTMFGGE